MPKPAIILSLLAVALIAGFIWYWFFRDYRYGVVQKGVLYRDGLRTHHEFNIALRRARPKTVVSLICPEEMKKDIFAGEEQYLSDNGVRLIRIPLYYATWPTADQVRQFIDVVQNPDNQPVLVHCAQGVIRTGFMVTAYQSAVMKQEKQKIIDNIPLFGKGEHRKLAVSNYISNFDPLTLETTAMTDEARKTIYDQALRTHKMEK